MSAIRHAAEPLPPLDGPAFGPLFDRFAEARVVLLGEASHGTGEFYRARRHHRRLIEAHGFTFVAAEADWPDASTLDAFGRHKPTPAIDGEARASRRPSSTPSCGSTRRRL